MMALFNDGGSSMSRSVNSVYGGPHRCYLVAENVGALGLGVGASAADGIQVLLGAPDGVSREMLLYRVIIHQLRRTDHTPRTVTQAVVPKRELSNCGAWPHMDCVKLSYGWQSTAHLRSATLCIPRVVAYERAQALSLAPTSLSPGIFNSTKT